MGVHIRGASDEEWMAQINTTPLVDVMLVLLIVFLITIPVVNTSVGVRLPLQANQERTLEADTVVVSVDAAGGLYWFDDKLPDIQALVQRLGSQTRRPAQVQIRADAALAYASVGRVVEACEALGIARVGFITEPPAGR